LTEEEQEPPLPQIQTQMSIISDVSADEYTQELLKKTARSESVNLDSN